MEKLSITFFSIFLICLIGCNSSEELPLLEDPEADIFSLDSVLMACGSQDLSNYSWLQASIEYAISIKDLKFSYSAKLVEYESQYFVVIQETWIDEEGGSTIITCNYNCSGIIGTPDSMAYENYMKEITVLDTIYSKTGTAKNPTY